MLAPGQSKMKIDMKCRRAGLVLPLSALRSRDDAGAGDMGTIIRLLDWMDSAGLRVLQLLPLNDLAPLDSSPYSPISAFAIDPLYACLGEIPEIESVPAAPQRLKTAARVRFADVRAFKATQLRIAFRRFEKSEWRRGTKRAKAFGAYCRTHSGWLTDYALFRILKERGHWKSWQHWPAEYRLKQTQALAALAHSSAQAVRFYQYTQWILDVQWRKVRREAAKRDILLYGDIPFGLSKQSVDVWSRQDDFDFTATMGAPPDQYSATGQAWGLPAYRWDRMASAGHPWWRLRISRAKEHFDLFRLDHAIGFFRTWFLRRGRAVNGFDISGAARQRSRGEQFFKMVLKTGAPSRPIAEDLGLIPPFAYGVLKDLGIPGYKLTRAEIRASNGPFKNPRKFPELSVATPGNHDMSTLAAWWSDITPRKRNAYWRLVSGKRESAPRFSPAVLETLLKSVYHAGSALAMFPFQDLFGTRERINIPGTVRNRNWVYRMPMTVEDLLENPSHAEKARMLRGLAEASGRL